MDIKLERKTPIKKHKYLIGLGGAVIALLLYLVFSTVGPKRVRCEKENLRIVEVVKGGFQEYIETEGITHPIMTVRITTAESGVVQRIIPQPGATLVEGDTIVVLANPELLRTIDDERDNLEKQRVLYREKLLQMERKTSELKRSALRTKYELDKLSKKHELDNEEFKIGLMSKAQLEMAVDEYNFTKENTQLQLEELRNDSLSNLIQAELMKTDLLREELKYNRSCERLKDLIICAPVSGLLSFIGITPGERVGVSTNLGEMKVVDELKISIKVSEYYIERIQMGVPATLINGNDKIPLRISRINPEVNVSDRNFEVDLVFVDQKPENIALGKSYRVQMELGQPIEALVMDKGNFYQSTGGRWIFKLDKSNEKARRTDLVVGRQNTRQYEILEGLELGDRVVISGYDNFGDAQELIIK